MLFCGCYVVPSQTDSKAARTECKCAIKAIMLKKVKTREKRFGPMLLLISTSQSIPAPSAPQSQFEKKRLPCPQTPD